MCAGNIVEERKVFAEVIEVFGQDVIVWAEVGEHRVKTFFPLAAFKDVPTNAGTEVIVSLDSGRVTKRTWPVDPELEELRQRRRDRMKPPSG